MAAQIVPLRPLAVAAACSIVAAWRSFLRRQVAADPARDRDPICTCQRAGLLPRDAGPGPAARRLRYPAAPLTIFGALAIMVELIRDNVAQVCWRRWLQASLRELSTPCTIGGLKRRALPRSSSR
jgi:hypothetical protein